MWFIQSYQNVEEFVIQPKLPSPDDSSTNMTKETRHLIKIKTGNSSSHALEWKYFCANLCWRNLPWGEGWDVCHLVHNNQ